MSRDESLRLVAEVVDKFSGPLRNLRSGLQGMSREGMAHGKGLNESFNRVEGAARSAGQAVNSTLNPALAAVGVSGLTATGAMTAVGAAVRAFSKDTAELARLGRDVSMSTQSLREFQSVAGKFGISGDAANSAAQTFATSMRDIRRGVGETYRWLSTQDPATAQFAIKLKNTTTNEEAKKLIEDQIGQYPNPIDGQKLAEKVFGNPDFGRLRDTSKLKQAREEAKKDLGGLTKDAEQQAERLEHAMKRVGDSMTGIRDAIGGQVASPLADALEKLNAALNDTGTRDSGIEAFKKAIADVKAALEGLSVEDIKAGVGAVFDTIATAATGTVKAIEAVGKAVNALQLLKEGKFREGFAKLGELDRATDLGMGAAGTATRNKVREADKATELPGVGGTETVYAEKARRTDRATDTLVGQNQIAAGTNALAEITGLKVKIKELEERRARNDTSSAGPAPERQAALTAEMEKLTAELKLLREGLERAPDATGSSAAGSRAAVGRSMAAVGNTIAEARRPGAGIEVQGRRAGSGGSASAGTTTDPATGRPLHGAAPIWRHGPPSGRTCRSGRQMAAG